MNYYDSCNAILSMEQYIKCEFDTERLLDYSVANIYFLICPHRFNTLEIFISEYK